MANNLIPIWQAPVNSVVRSGVYGWLLIREQTESGTVVTRADLTTCTLPLDNTAILEYTADQIALAGFFEIVSGRVK